MKWLMLIAVVLLAVQFVACEESESQQEEAAIKVGDVLTVVADGIDIYREPDVRTIVDKQGWPCHTGATFGSEVKVIGGTGKDDHWVLVKIGDDDKSAWTHTEIDGTVCLAKGDELDKIVREREREEIAKEKERAKATLDEWRTARACGGYGYGEGPDVEWELKVAWQDPLDSRVYDCYLEGDYDYPVEVSFSGGYEFSRDDYISVTGAIGDVNSHGKVELKGRYGNVIGYYH